MAGYMDSFWMPKRSTSYLLPIFDNNLMGRIAHVFNSEISINHSGYAMALLCCTVSLLMFYTYTKKKKVLPMFTCQMICLILSETARTFQVTLFNFSQNTDISGWDLKS